MEAYQRIKELYRPRQPSVRSGLGHVTYEEIAPATSLQDFIYCYWQLKTTQELEDPFVYRVVSDGCIDIFFNHHLPQESSVMGFCRKFTEFPIGTNFDYIGIRFFPAAFAQLFGVDAKTLSNHSQELNIVLPKIATFIQTTITTEHSLVSIAALFNDRLAPILKHTAFDFDLRFYRALVLILENHGHLKIENGLNTGLSPRQLRRVFNHYIGTTPKIFSKVVRFQYILNAKPSSQSLKQQKLFYDVGFYDQAHFIKDFKNFYGVTPARAFP